MTTAQANHSESDIFTAIRGFLLTVTGAEVVRGRDNLVSPIHNGIVVTPLFRARLSTNSHAYFDPVSAIGTEETTQSIQVSIQIDCYGDEASEWASIISTLWRDEIACAAMGDKVQPIDADDPQNLEFLDPEDDGYVSRWMLTGRVQVNQAIITPMEFLDTVLPPGIVGADRL